MRTNLSQLGAVTLWGVPRRGVVCERSARGPRRPSASVTDGVLQHGLSLEISRVATFSDGSRTATAYRNRLGSPGTAANRYVRPYLRIHGFCRYVRIATDQKVGPGCEASRRQALAPMSRGQLAVPRREHAKLVALGICEHGPRDHGLLLPDVSPGRPPGQQRFDQRGRR
jgi:hypothetical protein